MSTEEINVAGYKILGHSNCISTETYKRWYIWDEPLYNILHEILKIGTEDTVIECDSLVGIYTTYLSKLVKKVYALEPYIENFKLLVNNTRDRDNVVCLNMALSDKPSIKTIDFISCNDVYGYPEDDLRNTTICEAKTHNSYFTHTLESVFSNIEDKITVIIIKNNSYKILLNSKEYIEKNLPTIIIKSDQYTGIIVNSYLQIGYKYTKHHDYIIMYPPNHNA